MMLGDVMVDGVKGQGAGDLWWNASEEIEVSVNAIILFPELREERSEHMGKWCCFQELTFETRFTKGDRAVHLCSESIFLRRSLHLSRSRAALCFSKTSIAPRASDFACSNLRCRYQNLACSSITRPRLYG